MLYHTTRLALNGQFIQPSIFRDSTYPTTPEAPTSHSADICLVSIDLIISILQRYKAQYTLRTCPLVFVHGAIIAADVSLSTSQSPDRLSISENTNLPLLEAALEDLSYSWPLAGEAKMGLQKLKHSILWQHPGLGEDNSPTLGFDQESLEMIPTPGKPDHDFNGLEVGMGG